MQFHNNCFSEGLSVCKIERYMFDLHKYALMLNKELLEASKDDIKGIVTEIEKKEWSPHTKHTFKIMIRKFYKSIEGPEEKGVYPERIRWLHSNVKACQNKLPEELLTEEEVMKMINCSDSQRDRALISMLYESGSRISEIGLMKIKEVVFDEYGIKITISGKTGARRIRLVNSAPYLQAWLNIHPENQNPESYVWIGRDRKTLLSYARLSHIPKRLAKLAGIKKRIHPHLFRHSRATNLAKHLTESQMKSYLGWTASSKMAAIYVHLSGRDMDSAILKMNGIKIDEEKKADERLRALACARCKTINEATNKFCKLCGLVLNKEEADKILEEDFKRKNMDNVMEDLVKDKDVLKFLIQKIKERGLDKAL